MNGESSASAVLPKGSLRENPVSPTFDILVQGEQMFYGTRQAELVISV